MPEIRPERPATVQPALARADRFDVVVVGAGITGLAAAFELRRAGRSVVVLESTDRVGGSIATCMENGWLFELGPNTVVTRPEVDELIAGAGLAGERLERLVAARRRYFWHRGRLRALPGGPLGLLASPLLSIAGKARLLWETRVPRGGAGEESVAGFVRRRLGDEVLQTLGAPFVAGVYAGDPERLSMRWAFPGIGRMEAEHGSLLAAARAGSRGAPAATRTLISLRGGLESLPRRLAEIAGDVRLGTPAVALRSEAGAFAVATPDSTLRARRVVLAIPAGATARLLGDSTAGRSAVLGTVPYANVAVVGLGFRRAEVEHPLDAFGFLAPRGQGLRILGCVFSSSLFPSRAPADHVALTAILGGRLDDDVGGWDEDRLRKTAVSDLTTALRITGEPAFAVVRRWPASIAQPELGHGEIVDRAAEVERSLPGLTIAGNFVTGIAVGECAARGVRAAREIVAELDAEDRGDRQERV